MRTATTGSKPPSLVAAPSWAVVDVRVRWHRCWCGCAAGSRSSSFCPFKFLVVSRIFDIHLSNGLKLLSSSVHCVSLVVKLH